MKYLKYKDFEICVYGEFTCKNEGRKFQVIGLANTGDPICGIFKLEGLEESSEENYQNVGSYKNIFKDWFKDIPAKLPDMPIELIIAGILNTAPAALFTIILDNNLDALEEALIELRQEFKERN